MTITPNPVFQAFIIRYEEYISVGEPHDVAILLTSQEIIKWLTDENKLGSYPENIREAGLQELKDKNLLIS